VTDLALFDCSDYLIGNRQNCSVTKTGGDFVSAVDSGQCFIFTVPAKFQGLFNDRGKVLILSDVYETGIGDNLCGIDTVNVGSLRRHQAVCGKQNGSRNGIKFLLLILPCGTEVPFQMCIFFQFRIGMCREHLAVSIDIDALAFGLLKQCLKVIQIMSADNDEGTLFNGERNSHRSRCSVGLCIGFVQKCHALEVDFACL